MNKKLFSFLCFALIGLGGCKTNKKIEIEELAGDLPQEKIFQDDHTRSFLQSTEETLPDHYLFLSRTGAYEMDLYKDSKISDSPGPYWFTRWFAKDKYEHLYIFVENSDGQLAHRLIVDYREDLIEEQLAEGIHKNNKKKYPTIESVNLEYIFERTELDNKTIYRRDSIEIGPRPNQKAEKYVEEYLTFAYLFKNDQSGGLQVSCYSYYYEKSEGKQDDDLAVIYDWMLNGIRFVD